MPSNRPGSASANKQLELMERYMSEPGLTTASRSRVAVSDARQPNGGAANEVRFVVVYQDKLVETQEDLVPNRHAQNRCQDREQAGGSVQCIELDPDL